MRTSLAAVAAAGLAALLVSCGSETASPQPAPAPAPGPADIKSADVESQVPMPKTPIQDGEVIDAPPGKASGLACARAGCARPSVPEHALVSGGKKLLFCSREHLEEFRKTSAKE